MLVLKVALIEYFATLLFIKKNKLYKTTVCQFTAVVLKLFMLRRLQKLKYSRNTN